MLEQLSQGDLCVTYLAKPHEIATASKKVREALSLAEPRGIPPPIKTRC